jgi:hypothetical protein
MTWGIRLHARESTAALREQSLERLQLGFGLSVKAERLVDHRDA